jgi:hypothetical protein
MAKVRIEQLSHLIELLGEEIEIKLERPLVLREFLERLAGDRQEVIEGLFSGNRLNPDIFIVKGETCISLQQGIDRAIIEDSDEISLHQIGAGG